MAAAGRPAVGAPPGWRLRIHESLPSTSDLVARLAAAGEPEGLAVMARRQTAGRGTRGRGWESPAGNLHLSVLLRPRGPAREAALWGLLAGVVLRDALAEGLSGGSSAGLSEGLSESGRLTLKWPNDVLWDGAKCGGVLAEGAVRRDGLEWLCLGFGANLAEAPSVAGRATARAPTGRTPEAVAGALLGALDRWRRARLLEGFAPVRRAWLAAGPRPGERLSVSAPGGPVTGDYEGLGEDGSLLLRTGGRVHALRAGELGG